MFDRDTKAGGMSRRQPRRTVGGVAKPQHKLRYDWNDVVYFLEVARQRNLVRAAEKLKVDHTTVSRRIRELEKSLNSTLFKRSKSGFTLTEIGLRLLQYAEGMESQANSIVEAIGLQEADAGGAVRIAAMEGIGSFYLTKCIGDFNKLYPSIQVELITDTRLLDLSRREADIFVSFFRPQGKRLSIRKVGEFKISLYSSSDDPEGTGRSRFHRFHRRSHLQQGEPLAL
jgi:DNA-binding transcriptional LysR family regulator